MRADVLWRLPLLALAALALLAGLWAGLARLGWDIPPLRPAAHGPLMISGFLGTLVGLERAAAFRRPWVAAAPLASGLGALAMLIGLPDGLSRGLLVLGGLVLALAFGLVYRQHIGWRVDWAMASMALGALAWLAGSALWWFGRPLYQVTPWWVGFLVLTIAGERWELSRARRLPRAALILYAASVGLCLAGLVVSVFIFTPGVRLGGLGLTGLGLWLIRFDIARLALRNPLAGLTRYIAVCLLLGFGWLTAGGLLWAAYASYFLAGPLYDAMLHTVLLGFVFSMIFGHAPLIVPAVTGVLIFYRPAFYLHLALLHASILLRLAGDLGGAPDVRLWAGLLGAAAILLFLANTVLAARAGGVSQPASAQTPAP